MQKKKHGSKETQMRSNKKNIENAYFFLKIIKTSGTTTAIQERSFLSIIAKKNRHEFQTKKTQFQISKTRSKHQSYPYHQKPKTHKIYSKSTQSRQFSLYIAKTSGTHFYNSRKKLPFHNRNTNQRNFQTKTPNSRSVTTQLHESINIHRRSYSRKTKFWNTW